MPISRIRIATRKSALALWQANYVKDRLQGEHPGLQIELLPLTSRGDQVLDMPLAKVGGKGLFVKELEVAMLAGRADIAVHSMKDVPMEFPAGLHLPVICAREDPRDAFVSNLHTGLEELPQGAVVGTSSLRRQCQLLARRPDLRIKFLRGNVNTRLAKLDAGDYHAIILAAAGLLRLNMRARIRSYLSTDVLLPAGARARWASNPAATRLWKPCCSLCTVPKPPRASVQSAHWSSTSTAAARYLSAAMPSCRMALFGCAAWWAARTVPP